MYTKEKYTWKAWKHATKLSNPSREGLSTSLPPADLSFLPQPPFMRNHFWLCRDAGITISLSFLILLFASPRRSVRGMNNEGGGLESDRERERHWTRKALFPLYEFNPALSRHGLLFQTRGRHSTMRRRRRYIKRRVLFCKCAPGNWSSCCSSFGFFVCHFNQDLRRKEVLGVQSVQAGNPRRLCAAWRIFARIFFSPSFVKIELLWTIGKNNSKWK